MFGFFKKKPEEERHYNPTDITVKDIRRGWFVDYEDKTWEAVEEYEYDWGKNRYGHEFKLQNSENETLYLEIGDKTHTLLQEVRFSMLPQAAEIEYSIKQTDKPPRELVINNIRYYREKEMLGRFRNIDDEEWSDFALWEYRDDSERYTVQIEQWGDDEFEVYVGQYVPERFFTNITPSHG